jgi:hypothetical protein
LTKKAKTLSLKVENDFLAFASLKKTWQVQSILTLNCVSYPRVEISQFLKQTIFVAKQKKLKSLKLVVSA